MCSPDIGFHRFSYHLAMYSTYVVVAWTEETERESIDDEGNRFKRENKDKVDSLLLLLLLLYIAAPHMYEASRIFLNTFCTCYYLLLKGLKKYVLFDPLTVFYVLYFSYVISCKRINVQ